MKIKCPECKYKYNYDKNDTRKKQQNVIILCPQCFSFLEVTADEKEGIVTPCNIYKADELIAKIEEENGKYILISDKLNINQLLTSSPNDLQCYQEAREIIRNIAKRSEMSYFEIP